VTAPRTGAACTWLQPSWRLALGVPLATCAGFFVLAGLLSLDKSCSGPEPGEAAAVTYLVAGVISLSLLLGAPAVWLPPRHWVARALASLLAGALGFVAFVAAFVSSPMFCLHLG